MPEAVARRLKHLTGLDYVEGYGLSETMAPTHINPPDPPKKQCLGIPICDTDARVINPDTLQEAGAGGGGRDRLQRPQIFQGYWKNPDTAAQPASSSWTGSAFSAPATSAATTRKATSSWSTG
jgi:fatty-acyl-CoA synthase